MDKGRSSLAAQVFISSRVEKVLAASGLWKVVADAFLMALRARPSNCQRAFNCSAERGRSLLAEIRIPRRSGSATLAAPLVEEERASSE